MDAGTGRKAFRFPPRRRGEARWQRGWSRYSAKGGSAPMRTTPGCEAAQDAVARSLAAPLSRTNSRKVSSSLASRLTTWLSPRGRWVPLGPITLDFGC